MSPQDQFAEAIRLEENGEEQQALALWRQLAEVHPRRNVFLRLGHIANKLGLSSDAEAAFARAVELDSRCALALRSLGMLAIERGDSATAEGYLTRAGEIEPDCSGFTLLGVALRKNGKKLESEEAYRQAIRLDPEWDEAYFNLGVLLRNDRPSEAEVLFQTALELDPEYACAHRELGWLLQKRGDMEEAEIHLRRAVELDPADGWAHIYLGSVRWREGNPESAVAEFQVAAELEPRWSVPLWSLGNVYECVCEDFDRAQHLFERALELDPQDGQALTNLGRLFKKRRRFDLAREYLNRAVLRNPRNSRARRLLDELGADSRSEAESV